jgi:hypothetical protein
LDTPGLATGRTPRRSERDSRWRGGWFRSPFRPQQSLRSDQFCWLTFRSVPAFTISIYMFRIFAARFVDAEKQVADVATALDGARSILIERFAEDADLIGSLQRRRKRYAGDRNPGDPWGRHNQRGHHREGDQIDRREPSQGYRHDRAGWERGHNAVKPSTLIPRPHLSTKPGQVQLHANPDFIHRTIEITHHAKSHVMAIGTNAIVATPQRLSL